MANGIQEQRGLYGTFQQWYKDAKIPAKDVDQDRDGQTKPREVVAYVLSHLDKFSPKVQKEVDALRQAFRGLGFADADAVQILTGELKDGALKLVDKGKDFEKRAAAAKAENKPEEAARLSDLAGKSYRLALDLRPHTRLAHQHLSVLLYQQGKTEEGREHAVQAVVRWNSEKIPEMLGWLETLPDPDIKKKGALSFAGEALFKESDYKQLAGLYAWASLDAEKKGDAPKAKLYEEKCLLADEQVRPYQLNFTRDEHPQFFELYSEFRQAGIPAGVIKGNRVDNKAPHGIDKADFLKFLNKHGDDPRVQEVLKARGLHPPPWESAGFSGQAALAGRTSLTEKLSAYHSHLAASAKTEDDRFRHLSAAAEYGAQNASAQMDMAKYYLGKNQLKDAESFFLEAMRIDPKTPGVEASLKTVQLQYIGDLGKTIQEDLRWVDALLAKGEVAWAERLMGQVNKAIEERFAHHAKMLWEEPNHQLITSRIDAEQKFLQGRILELRADNPSQVSDAHFLYVLAESSAGVALEKDPKDAVALDTLARIRKFKIGDYHRTAAQEQEKEIQKDLGQVDALLAKGKTAAAEKLLKKTILAAAARQNDNARFLDADPAFATSLSRIDAGLKFRQAQILELRADTAAQLVETGKLYSLAESGAKAVLEKEPKDASALELVGRIQKVRATHQAAALKQDEAIQKDFQRVDALLAKGDFATADRLLNKTWETVAARWNAHSQLMTGDSSFQVSTARIDAELKFRQAKLLELNADTTAKLAEAARVYGLAEDSVKAALEKAPKDPVSYLLRARIRHVRENYKGAVDDFAAALANAPDAATKDKIALQWSFYLQELRNLKAELKRERSVATSMVVPRQPFETYRATGRELAVTQALHAVAGSGTDKGLWIPDPAVKDGSVADTKAVEFQTHGKEIEELSKLAQNSKVNVALNTYQGEVNKVAQKVGLKAADLPASVLTFVDVASDGTVSFKKDPFPAQQGYVAIAGKSDEERKAEVLRDIHKVVLIRLNQQQAAAATDPIQKSFYETQVLMLQDRIPEARLKMMELVDAGNKALAADPQYFEKNPDIGAMVEQSRQVLKGFSLKALDDLSQSNELLLAQREATERVPKATAAKLNKVLLAYLRREIESGRAVTLDDALANLKAEDQRLKAAGEDFKVTAYNMVSPFTDFKALDPGAPQTIAYLTDGYFGWEKDGSFRMLLERDTRAGLEKSRGSDQERSYNLQIAKELRGNSDYPAAAEIFEKLFSKDLDAAKQKITPDRLAEIKKEVQDDWAKLEKEIRETIKKSGKKVSEEDIKLAVDQAVEAKTDLAIRSEAYAFMDDMTGSHDSISREAWKQFNDMKDPNDEWDNLADQSWDALKQEAIVMAVTLPLTMGAGAVVRAGMGGTNLAIRLLNAGRWVRVATQGGILISGAAVEGLVQTFLTSAIHNKSFEWREVGFNIVTSLAFHGGGKAWGATANKLGFGQRAIEEALRRGESVLAKRIGNFTGMMVMQTELSTSMNYLVEQLYGPGGGPGFWSLERHLGEGIRQVAYHGATLGLNKATRNWAANAEMRARLKAESAADHYLDLMKTGKYSTTEARKLAADMAHKEIPSVFGGEDPKQIGGAIQFRKANRLVEKLGVDPKSIEGQNLAMILLQSGDIAGLEKKLTADFKDLDGFVRERLNIDPTSEHGKNLMKYFAESLGHGANREVLLKEFPELGRLLEAQDAAAKQVLEKAGVGKAHGQEKLAPALVALALERGWSVEDLARFGEVLAQRPELLANVVDKLGGGKAPYSATAGGKKLTGLLLLDAMRASPDFESFAATLMNLDAHANFHMDNIEQAGLLLGNASVNLKIALFRWSAGRNRSQSDWNQDLQGMLEGRVEFRVKDGVVERHEVSEAEGAAAQKETAKKFAALNNVLLDFVGTENFSAENQKLAMEGMADRVLRSAGYKPGTPDYQAHREFLLKHLEAVARGETNPEDGNWPKVAVDLEAHLRNGGTMTYVNKDGSQYKLGPAKKTKPKAPATGDSETTKVEGRTKPDGKTEKAPQANDGEPTVAAARGKADRKIPIPAGDKPTAAPTPTPAPKTETTRVLAGLLLSADGMDGFSADPNSTKPIHWSSADKKLPGDPWALDLLPTGDGAFNLVPKKGKTQYEERGKWVDVPKDGVTLRDGMSLKLGDIEFNWRAPNADNAGNRPTGTRQAGEHLIGELFKYYEGAGVRETLKKVSERKDAWGADAREFQLDLKGLQTLWKDYVALEKAYRADPSLPRREALNQKWGEVQAQGEKLHNSKYHQAERAYFSATQAVRSSLLPLETLLGSEQLASLQQGKQNPDGKHEFSYELNFTPPEKIGDYAKDWKRVPSEKLVSVDIKVNDRAKALDLVKKLQDHSEIRIVGKLEFDADQKVGKMTVEVNGRRVVIHFELATVGPAIGIMIANQIREEREQLDLMRAELRQMKEGKQDPAKVAEFEKTLADAEATFKTNLQNRQRSADGLPLTDVDPWASPSGVSHPPGKPAKPLAGVAGLFAGIVTLLVPEMAQAADKASDASSGGTAPWIVGATLLALGSLGAYIFKRSQAAKAPPPQQLHPMPVPGWGPPVAPGGSNLHSPLDLPIASQGPLIVGRGQIPDPAISAGHATVVAGRDGFWYVLDGTVDGQNRQTPSSNGIHGLDSFGRETRMPTQGWHAIAPGQMIRMGNTWVRLPDLPGHAVRPQDGHARAQVDRVQARTQPDPVPPAPSLAAPAHAFFGNADPRAGKVGLPVFESRALMDASGRPVGEAQICAGNKTGELGLRFRDGSIAGGKTTEGGRSYQEDGIYMSRFTLPDGTEVKVIAGADGAGGMGGGDVASSAFLQGVHARVAQATARGEVPLAADLFADGYKAVAKQKELGDERSKNATGTGAIVVIVGDQATIATAGDAMVALSRKQADGSYETLGYSHIDNHASSIIANGISSNMPGLYVVRGLQNGDRFTIGSDGAWENLLGEVYKDRGSSYMRQDKGLPTPTQDVFKALNLFAEATGGRTDAAAVFHDLALGNIRKPGQTVQVQGKDIRLPAKRDVDNIFALNYEHQNGPTATKPKVGDRYVELEPVPSFDSEATKVIAISERPTVIMTVPGLPEMSPAEARKVPGHIDLTEVVPGTRAVEFYAGNPAAHGNIPTLGRVTVQDVAHNRRPELFFVAQPTHGPMNLLTGFSEPLLMISPQRNVSYTGAGKDSCEVRKPEQGPFALRAGDRIQLGLNEFKVVPAETGGLILVPDALGGTSKVTVSLPWRSHRD